MKKAIYILSFSLFFLNITAQNYPPAVGQPGSTAIHIDSAIFTSWVSECSIERGYINISDTSVYDMESNIASHGLEENGIGASDNNVVSLGDKGIATLYFDEPIRNNPGFDFAVFENSFIDTFLELAFVEVSSDGINYIRFQAYSNTQTETQLGTFGEIDPTYIHNLAGKYRISYGTPFDLNDLIDSSGIDLNSIHYVRLIDVAGIIELNSASLDANGNIINDPWPTPFSSCGFDLDAVGVLQAGTYTNSIIHSPSKTKIYPNPAKDFIYIRPNSLDNTLIEVFNNCGKSVEVSILYSQDKARIDLEKLKPGMYMVSIVKQNSVEMHKVLKIN